VRMPFNYWGAYFFADLCGGWISARHPDGDILPFATGISQPVDLAFAADDSLYYLARGGSANAGAVYRITYDDPAPSVRLTVNGAAGPVNVAADQPLVLEFAFDSGGPPLASADVYIGLFAPFGVYWMDASNGFGPSFARAYTGSLATVGPTPVVYLRTAGVLPPGQYWWFIVVDRAGDGVLDTDKSAIIMSTIREP
jgi:hypothetical protein